MYKYIFFILRFVEESGKKIEEGVEQHAAAVGNRNEGYLTDKHCRDSFHSLDFQKGKITS